MLLEKLLNVFTLGKRPPEIQSPEQKGEPVFHLSERNNEWNKIALGISDKDTPTTESAEGVLSSHRGGMDIDDN